MLIGKSRLHVIVEVCLKKCTCRHAVIAMYLHSLSLLTFEIKLASEL